MQCYQTMQLCTLFTFTIRNVCNAMHHIKKSEMESEAIQILFQNFFNLSESSGGNSVQSSERFIKSMKRKRSVLILERKHQRRKISKKCNFWDVISKMTDDVFSSHFGMNINTFKVNN